MRFKQTALLTLTILAWAPAKADVSTVGAVTTFGANVFATSVSADGRTVVGYGNGQDFMLTSKGEFTWIGGTAPGTSSTGGRVKVNADGTRISGNQINSATGFVEAAYYTPSTGTWQTLGSLGGHSTTIEASNSWAMSSNGNFIAGAAWTKPATGSATTNAMVWNLSGASPVQINLGSAPNVQSRINSISDDGRVAVGYTTGSRYGSVWIDDDGDGSYTQKTICQVGYTTCSSSGQSFEGMAVSANGRYVVGSSFNTGLPYLYDTTTGVTSTFPKLSFANLGKSVAIPSFVSNDGKTIFGSHLPQGATLAGGYGFIWTESGGVQNLDDYFAGLGIDTANNFNFVGPMDMSADGRTIVGTVKNNITGNPEGFMVTIPSAVPEPSSYALMGMGLLLVAGRARRRSR